MYEYVLLRPTEDADVLVSQGPLAPPPPTKVEHRKVESYSTLETKASLVLRESLQLTRFFSRINCQVSSS